LNESKKKGGSRAKLALAAIVAAGSLSLAAYQYVRFRPTGFDGRLAHSANRFAHGPRQSKFLETDDGRQLLWARGPRDARTGEWFDVTGSPLDPQGYQFGIGKDAIPAIDQPAFVAIQDRKKLVEHGIDDETPVLGYVHNGEAKAYPIGLMTRRELVNDVVGGKPVTVGW